MSIRWMLSGCVKGVGEKGRRWYLPGTLLMIGACDYVFVCVLLPLFFFLDNFLATQQARVPELLSDLYLRPKSTPEKGCRHYVVCTDHQVCFRPPHLLAPTHPSLPIPFPPSVLYSVSEMVNAMMKTQPDGNDDSGGAQAALCALFRSEHLDPARVRFVLPSKVGTASHTRAPYCACRRVSWPPRRVSFLGRFLLFFRLSCFSGGRCRRSVRLCRAKGGSCCTARRWNSLPRATCGVPEPQPRKACGSTLMLAPASRAGALQPRRALPRPRHLHHPCFPTHLLPPFCCRACFCFAVVWVPQVSCAALMGQTSSAWGGQYHPRGGFR